MPGNGSSWGFNVSEGLEHVRRGNFPESGKFHAIRIPDRVLVFKYFAEFRSLRGHLENFNLAAPQYPISHSGWRPDKLRGSIDCALQPEDEISGSGARRAAAVVYSGTLAPSLKGSLHCFLPRCTYLRPEKVELIYLRTQEIVAWTIMLDPRSNSRQISVIVVLGKVPRSPEHQHAQSTVKAAAARHASATSRPVLAAGRAASGVCATAVMHAGCGRQTPRRSRTRCQFGVNRGRQHRRRQRRLPGCNHSAWDHTAAQWRRGPPWPRPHDLIV
jgi:hypothetical protein